MEKYFIFPLDLVTLSCILYIVNNELINNQTRQRKGRKMETTQITTIEDLKGGYFGNVYHKGTFGGHDLYVAEIADPYDNETGWECSEWHLVKDNQAVSIANCDGYNGIDWRVDDDDLLDLLGDDDIIDAAKEAVVPYSLTGALIAAAREAELEDAPDDYDGDVAIWVTRCYSASTLGAPTDGFLTDEDNDAMIFSNASEAQVHIDEMESGAYVLSHGEMCRPSYRIVKH